MAKKLSEILEGDVVGFKRGPDRALAKSVPNTNLERHPASDHKLSKSQLVYRTLRYAETRDPRPPTVEHGEVVHHNARDATIKWDSGIHTVHSRTMGTLKGDLGAQGPFGPELKHRDSANWIADKARTDSREKSLARIHDTHKIYHNHMWGDHHEHIKKFADDATNAFKKHGIKATYMEEGPTKLGRHGEIRVDDPDTNKIARVLKTVSGHIGSSKSTIPGDDKWDAIEMETNHKFKTDGGQITASYYPNEKNSQSIAGKGLDKFASDLGWKKVAASKVPGWDRAHVSVHLHHYTHDDLKKQNQINR